MQSWEILNDFFMAQWDKIGSRGSVQDRRGSSSVLGGIGVTGIVIVLAVAYFGGGDQALEVYETIQQTQSQSADQESDATGAFAGEDEYEVFASTVLGSANAMWDEIFTRSRRTYEEPTLVLFRQGTQSACGGASSGIGPHYCPLDATIYLDETFFDDLTARYGARGGDVAEAYVIAHEVGHHAQALFGINEQVRTLQQQNPSEANALSVKQELQADCFAGLWAESIADQGVFDGDEIIEAMDAASAVGDDNIQEKAGGRVTPENWTHGSSADRRKWFSRGYTSGVFAACDTFAAASKG